MLLTIEVYLTDFPTKIIEIRKTYTKQKNQDLKKIAKQQKHKRTVCYINKKTANRTYN